jgi:DNA-nicking Smr family endonuclease
MENTNSTATENNTPAQTEQIQEGGQANEKTFTQSELDKIVQDRVREERSKLDEYKAKAAKFDEMEEASKTELQKATEKAEKLEAELKGLKEAEAIKTMKDGVAAKTGVPAALLHGKTEEECKEEAKAIIEFAKSYGYPNLKDGGEVRNTSGISTSQQFADWMKKNTK